MQACAHPKASVGTTRVIWLPVASPHPAPFTKASARWLCTTATSNPLQRHRGNQDFRGRCLCVRQSHCCMLQNRQAHLPSQRHSSPDLPCSCKCCSSHQCTARMPAAAPRTVHLSLLQLSRRGSCLSQASPAHTNKFSGTAHLSPLQPLQLPQPAVCEPQRSLPPRPRPHMSPHHQCQPQVLQWR